jgi:hypothetical protein
MRECRQRQKKLARLSLDDAGEQRIVERVIDEGGGLMHPLMLTRANYSEWALVMKVQMEAEGLWTSSRTSTAPLAKTGMHSHSSSL